MRFLDFFGQGRFFGEMNLAIPPEALRVARALVNTPQSEVAQLAGISSKTLQRIEAGGSTARASEGLQAYYERMGVVFTGSIDLSTGTVSGAGARWRMPPLLPPDAGEALTFRTETFGVHFRAARAFLDRNQKSVADESKLPTKTIIELEQAADYRQSDFNCLRDFYEVRGIEFLSWGDTSKNIFYGVGVRQAVNLREGEASPLVVSKSSS
ncbi:helix-turn-helix domain-containing protein [Rhizobium ruizarguesonis]